MRKKLKLLGIICVAWTAFLWITLSAMKHAGYRLDPVAEPRPAQNQGDAHLSAARYPCTKAIEASAKYQARFKHFGTIAPTDYRVDGSRVVYAGDDVELQNGFGAWQTVRYRCTFDPESGQATAVVMPR